MISDRPALSIATARRGGPRGRPGSARTRSGGPTRLRAGACRCRPASPPGRDGRPGSTSTRTGRPESRIRRSSPSPTRCERPCRRDRAPGRPRSRQRDQGLGHVADVDEVAAGVEVADGAASSGPVPVGQDRGEPAERLAGRAVPGPIGLKTRATIASIGGRRQRRPRSRRACSGRRRRPGAARIGPRRPAGPRPGTGPSSAAEPTSDHPDRPADRFEGSSRLERRQPV